MMSTPRPHQPVMVTEVLEALAIRPDGIYLDGTVVAEAMAPRSQRG
jgi:16S rRNA C1402 N4-methylase RsmH